MINFAKMKFTATLKVFFFVLTAFLLLISLTNSTAAQGTYTCEGGLVGDPCQTNTGGCDPGYTAPAGACQGTFPDCPSGGTCLRIGGGSDIFGTVFAPPGVERYSNLSVFIGNIIKILIVIAGIWTLFNFVFAGYLFLSAGDDPKKIQSAWQKIYLSAIGLTIAAGSFVLAGVFGQLIFGDTNALLQLRVFGP